MTRGSLSVVANDGGEANEGNHISSIWLVGVAPLLGQPLANALEECGRIAVTGIFAAAADLGGHDIEPPDIVILLQADWRKMDFVLAKSYYGDALVILASYMEDGVTRTRKIPDEIDIVLPPEVDAADMHLFIELARKGYSVVSKSAVQHTEGLGGCSLSSSSIEFSTLTARERRILACLVEGFSNKQIANEIGGSIGAVKVQLRALMKKVQAENRTKAAVLAVKSGFEEWAEA